MKVKDIMNNIVKVPIDITVVKAAMLMKEKNIGSVVIQDGDDFVGILTERDILNKIVAAGKDTTKEIVKNIMSGPILTIDVDSDISEASEKMEKHNIRRLLVEENNKIAGIITLRDVTKSMRYTLARKYTLGKDKQYQYSRPDYYGHKVKE